MRIAIVKLSSIGDIAQTAFVTSVLTKHYPGIIIDWFCDRNFVDIIEPDHKIANIYPVISKNPLKNFFKFITQFRNLRKIGIKNRYNVVLDLQGTFKSAFVAREISTNSNLWGFKNTRDSLAPKFYKKHFNSPLSENVYVRAINAVNQALGLKVTMDDISVPFIHTYSEDLLCNFAGKAVLIFPSSSVARKNYSVENWVKTIENLAEYSITLLYGSEAEKLLCEKIANGVQKYGVQKKLKTVGGKSLAEIKMLLLEQNCVIGADTGILHIANGLGVKNITLYGPTPQYRTSISTQNSIVLQGNGDVNKIPVLEVVKSVKLLIG